MVEAWDFERLSRKPLVAAAFEAYTRKALCHEWVLFLREVSRYQSGDFSEPAGLSGPSQYQAFCRINDVFIRPGSREEVSISGMERKRLMELVHKGQALFEAGTEEERRLIFARAYLEVKAMLEDNLLRRFLQTDRFKSVRAQRRMMMQRESFSTMAASPHRPAEV
ncbi:unnamed protein product [Ectocarpus sp. 4 AP-2014]